MTESCPISDYNFYAGKEAPSVEIRGTLNRQMIGGVTDFNNYLQLQHEDGAGRTALNDYIARVVSQLSGGVRASRIAVYYPIETLWTRYRPLPSGLRSWDDVAGGAPEAQQLSGLFDRVSDCLMDNGWEFSYIDAQGIEESKVENGYLVHGNLRWDVLILPGAETLSEEMFERIFEFASRGGKVIVLESLPRNSFTEFPSETVSSGFEKMLSMQGSIRPAVYFERTFDPETAQQSARGHHPPRHRVERLPGRAALSPQDRRPRRLFHRQRYRLADQYTDQYSCGPFAGIVEPADGTDYPRAAFFGVGAGTLRRDDRPEGQITEPLT